MSTPSPSEAPRPLPVSVESDVLRIGQLSVSFIRTLRLPDDGKVYPLPPGLGTFPVRRVADYEDRVPASWLEHGGVFFPMFQREAAWLGFTASLPQALKVAVGLVNAITGKVWDDALSPDPQDYLVCPSQPWLDGINAGDGVIKQFVAMPLGHGYTVEGQVTGEERFGGIQLLSFAAHPDRLPPVAPSPPRTFAAPAAVGSGTPPAPMPTSRRARLSPKALRAAVGQGQPHATEMGLAAGGRMKQSIHPDPHGIGTWDLKASGRVYVHIVNSAMWHQITGEPVPWTPVDAALYAQFGLPWYDLYDEHLGDLPASEILEGVRSIADIDRDKGVAADPGDSTVEIPDGHVVTLPAPGWPKLPEHGERA